ncbi:hypothetical protein [Pimelobacter simplex]|uniref:hypothetical protein n=1 Tax=Nocardioides simplex TaxID=2045 RepID=UPI003AAAB3BA
MKSSRHRWPTAGPQDALSPCDIRSILDTHGLRVPTEVEDSEGAIVVHAIYETWVDRQQINPRHRYVIPFRVTIMLLLELYPAVTAWRLLSDAINDPDAGFQIVRLRFSRRAA